jgi:hypothetical protein
VNISSTVGKAGEKLTSRMMGTKSAAAPIIAAQEQQTRRATIAAMIFGADDGLVPVSIDMDLLRYFVHLTLDT